MHFIRRSNIIFCTLLLSLLSTAAFGDSEERQLREQSGASSIGVAETSALFEAILAKDHIIFNVAFNQCDETEFERILSADFEFYHDKGGVAPSREAFIKLSRERRCEQNIGLVRKMTPKTVQVFPLHKNDALYGAVQTGDHEFYLPNDEGVLMLVETSSYTTLWMLEDGDWKMTRALSYNHVSVPAE